jgi:hypothetical protein
MITITWHTNRETSWECDWIEHLFSKVPHQTITDYQQTQYIDNSYIVYNAGVNIDNFALKMFQSGKKFGLIHLSDEWDRDSTANYALADVVLRNYYKDLGPKVINFPLGWMRTFPHDITPPTISERKHIWSFTGHVDKTTRPEMAKWMTTVPNGHYFFKQCGQIWGPFDGHALDPTQMAELYRNSVFVPCPQGNCSIDSFRVTEALQAGALPIVESSDYWNNLYGDDHPLLQIVDWATAPALINVLLKDPVALENYRANTYSWWIAHCEKLQNKIAGLL